MLTYDIETILADPDTIPVDLSAEQAEQVAADAVTAVITDGAEGRWTAAGDVLAHLSRYITSHTLFNISRIWSVRRNFDMPSKDTVVALGQMLIQRDIGLSQDFRNRHGGEVDDALTDEYITLEALAEHVVTGINALVVDPDPYAAATLASAVLSVTREDRDKRLRPSVKHVIDQIAEVHPTPLILSLQNLTAAFQDPYVPPARRDFQTHG